MVTADASAMLLPDRVAEPLRSRVPAQSNHDRWVSAHHLAQVGIVVPARIGSQHIPAVEGHRDSIRVPGGRSVEEIGPERSL